MPKMLSSAVVRLIFMKLLLLSVTTAKGKTAYSTDRPKNDLLSTTTYLERFVEPSLYNVSCPVINVELLPGNQIMATQKPFLIDPLAVVKKKQWNVSLNYQTKDGKYGMVWMHETNVLLDLPLNSSDDWILFDCDTKSEMCLVNYDAILWDRITKQLNDDHTVFTNLSRARLINDATYLADAEYIGYDTFLRLLSYASEEKDCEPWFYIYHSINSINSMIFDTANFSHFQRYVLNLTSPLMDELQVKYEGSHVENLKRRTIMSLSCFAGHKGCIENTTRLFQAWIKNEKANPIPAILAPAILCTGIANSLLESDWNTVYERLPMAKTYKEKLHMLRGLTCSRNVTLLERLLEYSIDKTKINPRYSYPIILQMVSRPASKNCVWKWLKLNSAKMDERVALGYSISVLEVEVYNLKTKEQRKEVSDFLENYPFVENHWIPSFLRIIDNNIRWMNKNLPIISNWLGPN